MKGKLKNILKRYWVIPVSLLLVLPVASIGSLLLYFMLMITGVEWLSYVLSYGAVGVVISLPIVIKVWNSDRMNKGAKMLIIVLSVLLFSMISYELFWHKKF